MSRHGQRLAQPDVEGLMRCPESGWRYREAQPGVVACLDWPEDESLDMVSPCGDVRYRLARRCGGARLLRSHPAGRRPAPPPRQRQKV
jgi:hypothetical protein